MGTAERLRMSFARDLTFEGFSAALAHAHGDRVLIVEAGTGKTHTANEIALEADRIAALVSRRSALNDRVVVALPNGWDFFVTCLGVMRAGRVVVPINPQMRADELEHVRTDSEATLVLKRLPKGAVKSAARPSGVCNPSDVAAVLYTSGTTGLPKGAELTHRGLLAGVQRAAAVLPLAWRDDEVVFALPVAHVMGFSALLGTLCSGVRTLVFDRFRPTEVLDAIETRASNAFIGVPAMYRMLEDAGARHRNLRSVRIWMSGADAMPPDLISTFQRYGASVTLPLLGTHIGQALFVEGYGMVELSGGVATKITPPYAGRWLNRPFAFPLPGNRMRVVDDQGNDVGHGRVGELLVTGPGVFRGYRGNETETERARTTEGWLRTGDLAKRRPFGVVELAGRAKNVIKVSGYSVFVAEIERVLREHPLVDEAVVIGLPDQVRGQSVAAVLRPATGHQLSARDIESVATFATERLSKYKVPTSWRTIDAFEQTGTGKVRREPLAALFGDTTASDVDPAG